MNFVSVNMRTHKKEQNNYTKKKICGSIEITGPPLRNTKMKLLFCVRSWMPAENSL